MGFGTEEVSNVTYLKNTRGTEGAWEAKYSE
jgi:hypothetical protein